MPDQNVQADVGYLTYIYSQPLSLQHQELQCAKVLSKKIHLSGNTNRGLSTDLKVTATSNFTVIWSSAEA